MLLEFLKAALAAIPSAATSGYALAAYALVVAAYVFTVWRVARNKNLLEHLEKLPPKDRLKALEIETGGVRLAAGISPEQWVRSRIHKYYLLAFLATCAVAVAIAALAALKGTNYIGTLTIINNEYRQLTNGQSLSISDLEHIQELIEAAITRDTQSARTAFNQLSEPARAAYERAYPLAKDNLVRPDELSAGGATMSAQPGASTQEIEPNNDILTANNIPLNATISGAIDGPSDADYFTFATSDPRRDYIDVILNNESTTLAPTVTVYNPDKSAQPSKTNSTRGGDVSYAFVAKPNSRYYVGISPYYDYGKYRLTVRPRKAFDEYEPNDDILNAKPIVIGKSIKAGIMDPQDVDYYRFETDNNAKLVISLENRSTTLAPTITVYNPDKSAERPKTNSTRGGDVSYSFAAQPNSRYYLAVSAYYDYGDYTLIVRPE
jgi:hypothetical protein